MTKKVLHAITAILAMCCFAVAAMAQVPLPDDFNPGASGGIFSIVVQPDGRILVGGNFTNLAGQVRNRIARLNADGSLDGGFNPDANNTVSSIALQPDGKILAGGFFTNMNGQVRNNIARLNPDGTLDGGFNAGASGGISSIVVQPDGKILAGGQFTTMAGQTRNRIARLNSDGTLDTAFNPNASSIVNCLAVQVDGKILVGGSFTTIGGIARTCFARLNANGTVDEPFYCGAPNGVMTMAVRPDGKIVVGGNFTYLRAVSHYYIGLVNPDGTPDETFNPGTAASVSALALQADGKILIGGTFTTFAGQPRNRMARLNADGTLDSTFNPNADSSVYALALQEDGKILAGGEFTTLAGQPRNKIARLESTGAATQSLTHASSVFRWRRGGTAPEVWRTTFDYTTNGVTWTFLGTGSWTNGEWTLGGMSVTDGAVRARGYSAGGRYSGSGGIVESVIGFGAPVIIRQTESRTNIASTTAIFHFIGAGAEPSWYQWRKGGVNLADGGNLTGVTNATLNISGVLRSDEGGYDVVCCNSYGSVTSTVATLNVIDPGISLQPMSQVGHLGDSLTLTVGGGGTGASYQWRKDGVVLPGVTNLSLVVSNVQSADAGSYDLAISATYGSITSSPAVVTVNLAPLDTRFDPDADGSVTTLALQPDGKILAGGAFTNMGGEARSHLARLNPDGTLDADFNPGASSAPGISAGVNCLALQADGKVLVGGTFSTLAGQARSNFGRLNADGTLDQGFSPPAGGQFMTMAVQSDGKILTSWGTINRLNADGAADGTFSPCDCYFVYCMAIQPDGKILLGGSFTTAAGQARNNIARLYSNGTLDTTFNPDANSSVDSLVVQADGKILMGGRFGTVAGQTRNRIARLNSDGTLDMTFSPVCGGFVNSLALQSDGKILVGGSFATMAGQTRYHIARLHPDGTLDTTFNPVANNYATLYALAVQADGNVVVGGDFTTLAGHSRKRIARLINTSPATQDLSYNGSTITWLRGGTAPEVWRTTFEHTTDGMSWTLRGAGSRIGGGWQLSGVSVIGGTIRARGYSAGGYHTAAGGIVEATVGAPVIVSQPASRTNNAGTVASFSVGVAGSGTFDYRWRKDGASLTEGGKFSGVTNATLNISDVLRSDEGGFDVICSNIFGVVTSSVATLTVVDPAINVSPLSQAGVLGGSLSFSGTAAGTGALTY